MAALDDDLVPVIASDAVLPGTVVAVHVDGEELVVWRGTDGVVCVTDARCPHEWTHLEAQGVVDGCELVCLSHFWRFDRSGQGTTVDEVTRRREARAPIRVVGCVERDGQVFITRGGATAP